MLARTTPLIKTIKIYNKVLTFLFKIWFYKPKQEGTSKIYCYSNYEIKNVYVVLRKNKSFNISVIIIMIEKSYFLMTSNNENKYFSIDLLCVVFVKYIVDDNGTSQVR